MFATIQEVPIWYIESGVPSGLPVVFIHGFPFSHEMWLPQVEATARSYRAIAYDLRGHGESYVGDGQYMIETHVDDLMGLLDHLKIGKAVVVGLSMGGYIALRAIEKHPGRFLAIALCDTRSEADTNEGKLKRYTNMVLVRTRGSAAFAEGFVTAVFAPESPRTRPEAFNLISRIVRGTQPLSIAGNLLALAARTDTTTSLAGIRVPTLILVGEFDTLTPPAAAEAMHERIPGSELFVVPQAAHMSNLENPEFFNEKLLLFLKKVAGSYQGSPG
jgi:pimeloyl-ACP methyl ester carboxylesterase